jgi:hypothetical protein
MMKVSENMLRPSPQTARGDRNRSSAGDESRRQMLIWCVVVFVLGALVRLSLLFFVSGLNYRVNSEPLSIALSLAATGSYADAYGHGAGPTAHCAPLYPVLLSMMVRIFGTGASGTLAINVFASTAAAAAFALLPALAVVGGLGLRTGLLAGIAGALLPVNYGAQISGAFEAPLTAVALVVLCFLLCRIWTAERFTKFHGAAVGTVAGFACLLSPALIPILAAWSVVSAVRFRQQLPRVLWFLGVGGLCVLSMLAPWAIRNYVTLGSPIFTRSNFGLELQVSNNDMMTADLERNTHMPEFALLHPHAGGGERAKVRRLGEVAYQRAKQQQALAWIGANKQRFLLLTAERFRLFWLPNMKRPWQGIFEALLTLSGLCGLVLLFWQKHAFAWLAGAAIVTYPAVYYVIQMSPRYRFPLEPILFLLATYPLAEPLWFGLTAVSRLIRRRPSAGVKFCRN